MKDKQLKGRCARMPGEANPAAKLTSDQVKEIRQRRSNGEKLAAIARDYGIKFQQVSKIARGERWAHGLAARAK
jgi:DNA invertase Pin-like site-specific DNA recombinase